MTERIFKIKEFRKPSLPRPAGMLVLGLGISDVGYNVAADWAPAGIDLAQGTWNQLNLDPSLGSARIQVTLLWQAGIAPEDACGFGVEYTTDSVNFRAGPSTNHDIRDVLAPGTAVHVTGSSENGFLPVMYEGLSGWVYESYLGG